MSGTAVERRAESQADVNASREAGQDRPPRVVWRWHEQHGEWRSDPLGSPGGPDVFASISFEVGFGGDVSHVAVYVRECADDRIVWGRRYRFPDEADVGTIQSEAALRMAAL